MTHPLGAIFPVTSLERLEEVDRRLANEVQSREPRLDAWTRDTIQAGGKRVRPLLLLTAFSACGGDALPAAERDQAIDAAVAIELVHTASLVHDDIMDESAERRGRPSIYAAHGRDAALLVGDYLFTQAFALAARLPKDAMDMTADACRRLCEGQLREQALHAAGLPDRQAYFEVIRDKTSSLLSAACGIGATMAKASPRTVVRMQRYGETLGHAFQILDDVLDVVGDPQWTGKPAGTDYLAGTLGSPYIHHLDRGGSLPTERSRRDFPKVRRDMLEEGSVAASRLDASGYTQDALLQLESLPASPSRRALERLAEHLMERTQ